MSILIHLFMSVGALTCTAAVAKYIWQARDSFKDVYNQIKEEYGRR